MANIFKKGVIMVLLVLSVVLPLASAQAVLPTLTTGDITASGIATKNWIEEALVYVRNKVATIFFQNILRKVLNEFAADSARYIAAGGKGQQALYVTQKWDHFWANIGDAAVGDFIESFANSVISDIAADEIVSEAADLCGRQKDECMAKAGSDSAAQKVCEDNYSTCLSSSSSEAADYEVCKENKSSCEAVCNGTYSRTGAADCLESCETVYLACSAQLGGATGAARRAPMFKASNSPLAKLNICNPSLSVGLFITLGLGQNYTGSYQTDCSFSEMVRNWGDQYQRLQDISSEDFLRRLSGMFKPGGSDLSAAFTLHSNLIEYRNKQVIDTKLETSTKKGWLDVRNIAGDLKGVPGQAESLKQLSDEALIENIGKVTGDILIDASNIFINQLAFNLWQNLMGNLTSYSGSGNLSYYSGAQVGRTSIENRLDKMTEPVFSEGGKLNVLSNLTACPDPERPAPDNCVITSQFSDAISGKMTVIDAVRSGRLPADWPFGFDKNGEDKIPYNQGYPYRSMLILRKFRILPVGWEVAAQEVQRKYAAGEFADRQSGMTLGDLLACFNPCDDVKGYGDGASTPDGKCNPNAGQAWCRGLVDPNWILKVPEYYCAREGYGPQLLKEPDLVATGKKYCSADEGLTIAEVEGKKKVCTTEDDCCTLAEAEEKQKRQQSGKLSDIRNFSCAATCAYEEQKLSVYRNDNYCGDEQGCIKEGRNGSCLFYGYCTSERRKWVFNKNNQDQACDPLYNTCQSFKAPDGKNVSYLTNTLDYGCTQAGVGCKEYSYNGTYEAAGDKVNWDSNQSIYFNKKVATCANKEEGCHEFIRLRDGNGVNILPDAGFEANDKARWSSFGSVVSKAEDSENLVYSGGYSLHVTVGAKGPYYAAGQPSLLPAGFDFDLNRYYTVSAFVYPVEGTVELVMGNSAKPASYQSVFSEGTGYWQELVLTVLNDSQLDIDFFALRAVETADFYVDNATVEIGAPKEYSAYGVGGLVYEKLLPAYLEATCYKDPANDFNLKDNAPEKCQQFVRKCQKDDVGCELYTEIHTKDTTAAQVKPTDYCPAECVGYDTFIQQANNFYSARDAYFIPKTARACNAKAVGCSLFVNLDKLKAGGESNEYFAKLRRCVKPDNSCAEFYTWEGSDQSGYQLVVYQLQENIAAGISQPAIADDDDPTDTKDGALCNDVVYALPNNHPDYNPDCRQFYGRDGNVSYHLMSKTTICSNTCYPYRLAENNVDVSVASEAACRAVAEQDGAWRYGFWDADKEECIRCLNGSEWQTEHQACVYMADPDKSQACNASEAGCSEYEGNFSNNIRVIFNSTFENNSLDNWGPTVRISSEALAVGGHSLQLTYVDNNIKGWYEKSVKNKIKVGKRYVLSFIAKKKVANVDIALISFRGDSGSSNTNLIFAENISLTPDWKQYKFDVKDLTLEDVSLAENLYININGESDAVRLDNIKLLETSETYYLIKNSWKTPESCDQDLSGLPAPLFMLGCAQYTDRDNKIHNLKSFDKLCQDSAVGCELMIDTFNSTYYGEQTTNGITVPADKFAYIVYEKSKECRAASKGCTRLGQADNAVPPVYKDVYLLNNPDTYGTVLCTKDQLGCEAWGTDGGGETYFKEPGNRLCEYRGNGWYKVGSDEVCAVSYNKTIGLGEPSEKVQPVGMAQGGNVGLCPSNQSGCTEYIDPESRASYNLLSGGPVNIKPDTLYIVRGGSVSNCSLPVYRLNGDNNLVNEYPASTNSATSSDEFYLDGNGVAQEATCNVAALELKEALVNYRLKDSLNKEKPTDVNFTLGQVLFNERSFSGGKYNALIYNTSASQSGQPQSAKPAEDNANALLKVDPDRECVTWLGCRSYIENPNKPGEKICYERGLCNRLNEAGECINFITPVAVDEAGEPLNQTYATNINTSGMANLTGFSKVGYENNKYKADLYHLANMKQEGETKVKFDGSFENTFDSGFTVYNNPERTAEVISDAKILEKELGFGSYKVIPDGRAVAKTNEPVVKIVDNVGGRYYVVSAWVYMRYGSRIDLTIGNVNEASGVCPLESINDDPAKKCVGGKTYGVIASTNLVGRWVRLSGKFAIANAYQTKDGRETKIKVGLSTASDSENSTYSAGLMYFDDVRVEPGLQAADDIYLHSDCRLYPEQDAMSCDYYDSSGLRKKGWTGYCLEYDPRNPGSCLLWYPVDKVESEEYEEGVALSIAKDLYYCVDAVDQCNEIYDKTQPEFYCKKFIKVDKSSYWYHRVAANSQYSIPYQLLDPTATDTSVFYADFGVNGGGKTDPIILDQKAGSGFFGAYSSSVDLNKFPSKAILGVSNKKLMPFVPYFGWSQAGGGDVNYYCRATLDEKGNDSPINVDVCGGNESESSKNLGTFDDCYVGVVASWDDCDSTDDYTCDQTPCCNSWNYEKRSGQDACGGSGWVYTWGNYDKRRVVQAETEDTRCRVEEKENKKFVGISRDIDADSDDSGCLFDCFNHTNYYRVAKGSNPGPSDSGGISTANKAVKTLFTRSDGCYEWKESGTNKYYVKVDDSACGGEIKAPLPCSGNVRPVDNEYCSVRPEVTEVKLNDNLLKDNSYYLLPGSGWVVLRFTTKVDEQQLPLTWYRVNWGFGNASLVRNVNMYARPEMSSPHMVYYFLDINDMSGCTTSLPGVSCLSGDNIEQCCVIRPSVDIRDNWGATNPGQSAYLDKPLMVVKYK